MSDQKNNTRKERFYDEEAHRRIPLEQLEVMEPLTSYYEGLSKELLPEKAIKIVDISHSYFYNTEWNGKVTDLYTVKNEEDSECNRYLSCAVAYWKKFQYPEYNGMYSIDMSIWSGINYMLDSSIWILEYVYRNNRELFEKLFSDKRDRVVKWSRGTDVQYYLYYFFHPEEMEFVKYMVKEIMEWLLSREEIIEVLKGERWIEGYIPPTPY